MFTTHTRHRFTIAAIVVAAAIVGGGLMAAHGAGPIAAAKAQAAPAAAEVDVAPVIARVIVDWQSYSGRLQAVDSVEIRPQVSGKLVKVNFQDGSLVRRGDVLFVIDPRPFQAQVGRAEGALAAARARASYSTSELARAQRLLDDNAVAKRDFDEKQNAAREASANLLTAQAALDAARLDLEYSSVTAPIGGRVSRAEVTLGNIVAAGPGTPPLTTLVSTDRVYASFDVDEQSFQKVVGPAQLSNSKVPVSLGLNDEAGFPHAGKLSSVDNRMDTSSGTIRVRAVFDNVDGKLVPGLYARVQLGAGASREAVMIDDKAVGTDQNKRFVMVIDSANKAAYREVTIGTLHEGMRVIEAGLAPNERIIVDGLQRVRSGDVVKPKLVAMEGSVSPRETGKPAKIAQARQGEAS
ncbi:efflux RND transporter periplasmic adaptor subunit [Cupriavidus sp. CV2]|uniref:efflux RND transporter periplasmic adaptor subunit n=1 Tax=Cupriavidus ulmosensis TaxID=3065913 RepID=UPI00296AE32D|nr:efflux RND transporter periplasmic adaptor subunit [Cupriavidus sp. CV2]MDW3686843.1 efflux RND transporter periplasmic adaptor subunit [Cupriavidus sp. CV2]